MASRSSDADVDAAVRFARDRCQRRRGSHGIRTSPRATVAARKPRPGPYLDGAGERDMVFGARPGGHRQDLSRRRHGARPAAARRGRSPRRSSRPAVEAGERLGFLPGDMTEKIDPYLRPLWDALSTSCRPTRSCSRLRHGRDRDRAARLHARPHLGHAFVILDEAQNATPMQMQMFLTRLGEGSRMVDHRRSQPGRPAGRPRSGLADAVDTLKDVEGVRFVRLTSKDVVRHDLVTRIVEAYDARDKKIKPDGR